MALVSPDGETTVIRIAGITAVRIEATEEPAQPEPGPERPSYDDLRFPMPIPADLTDLGAPIPRPAPAASRV